MTGFTLMEMTQPGVFKEISLKCRRSLLMMHFTLVLVLSFTFQRSGAQNDPYVDSLMVAVQEAREDSNKVNTLIELAIWHLDNGQNAEVTTYLTQARTIAEQVEHKNGLVTIFYYQAVVANMEGNSDEALELHQNSLALAEEIGNKSDAARAHYGMGRIYNSIGNKENAITSFKKALASAEEAGDKSRMIKVNNSLGILYDLSGSYPEALQHYLASLKMAEETGDKYGIGAANVNLGCLHTYLHKYEQTLQYNQTALAIWKELGHKKNMADAYVNIGEAYICMCEEDQAEKHTLLGLNLGLEIGHLPAVGTGYNVLATIYTTRGDLQGAVNNYVKALDIWKSLGNKNKIATTLNNLGSGYSQLGKSDEAIRYYNEALTLARKVDSKIDIQDAYRLLSKEYSANRDYEQALKYYQMHIHLKDSLWNLANGQIIAEAKEQFESEKKDKEIELLNKEKEVQSLALAKQKQRNTYTIAFLILVTGLSVLAYWNYHTRQQVKMLKLRNKIASDLHDDVGSTLSSISMFSQIARQQSKEAIPALEVIGESSRKMLDAMTDIVWTINPDNDQFEKIIMRMRSFAFEVLGAKHIDFEFVVDEEVAKVKLPMDTRKNLYLIFKESTNNMVKYAEADQAMFAIKKSNGTLSMMIRDNGKGFETAKEFSGNGLKNIRKRASEIGADLVIDSAPGNGTTIKLELAT